MAQRLKIIIITLLACSYFKRINCQSNYGSQANNIEYQGNGLPDQTVLDGKVTKLDDLSPVIFLNRTKAALNCAAGSMQVELKFNEKFHGIAYADFDRNSACRIAGNGDLSYKLELPLKGCGTRQDPQRVFTNNIVVRFHPSLEMDGDEVITIVCRYPPPVAPIPPPLPAPIREDAVPAPIIEPPLNGLQILLIICAILFLSLVLLGLGVSYYCLRRRHLTVVRRHPFSAGSGSEITKFSGSSLGNLSMFEGLKIPRAHAPVTATASSSGSEGPLISDTLPSDYPSESHSEIEDVDTRSLPVSSAGSFENKGYVHETSSFYSEGYGHTQEIESAVATTSVVSRLPLAVKEQPKFDVQVRVKRAPPSPPSQASISSSDTESSVARTERNLTTILEQREDSIRTMESSMHDKTTHFTYVPEIHPPPKYIQQPPVYSRILRRQQELQESVEIKSSPLPDWDDVDTIPTRITPARSMTSLNTEITDTHSVTEIVDSSHSKFIAPTPPPPPPIIPTKHYESTIEMEEHHEILSEPAIAPYRQPEITKHTVDDVYLKTITEKRTIEDIEKHKRLVTEYYTRPKMPQEPDQKWDVTIRNIPTEGPETPDWENFSDISSASNLTLTPKPERAQMSLPPQSFVADTDLHLYSPELVASTQPPIERNLPPRTYISTLEVPIVNNEVPNWSVLIRVLKPEDDPQEEALTNQLSVSDKLKWKEIITTESTLRTLLSEAVVRDDFERIRHDQRYEKLFDPPQWDVIIRILSPPERPKSNRFRKKSDWDSRSRRSSLPTLYEYDSDGGSSVRTLTNEPPVHSAYIPRTRRSSRSSYRSEADLRSMSEVMVDFARPDHIDNQSETSSYYRASRFYEDSEPDNDFLPRSSSQPSLFRSLSQPSLARSASEFTERWIAPVRYDTASEFTSPETTPKSQRSSRMQSMSSRYPGEPIAAVERRNMWESSTARQATQPLPHGGILKSQVVRQEYINETSTSFQSKSGWFEDNNSESSYK